MLLHFLETRAHNNQLTTTSSQRPAEQHISYSRIFLAQQQPYKRLTRTTAAAHLNAMVLAQPKDASPVPKKEARFALSPFPPVRLSASECKYIERLVKGNLQEALREYEAFGAPPMPREFPKSRWKVVKTHHNCTAYLDRCSRSNARKKVKDASRNAKTEDISSYSASVLFDPYGTLETNNMASGSHSSLEDDPQERNECARTWPPPDIVVSGSVPGTLDDVMYGMVTPDSAEMLLHTAYVDDHLLDGGVLQQLQLPTTTDPFRSICIKWHVKGPPSSYMKLLSARDFVFVEATGEVTRQDGVRLGYMLRHWLDLAGCGELKGLRRSRFSNCAIYTPLSNRTVDIFIRCNLYPGRKKMALLVATMGAAAALLSSSNAVFCSYSKKLVWLLNQRNGDYPASAERSDILACNVCAKKLCKFSGSDTCGICCTQMCSRCSLRRSLAHVDTQSHDHHAVVEHFSSVFCKNCVTQANQTSAFDVAHDEILKGRYGPVTQESSSDKAQPFRHKKQPSLTPILSCGWSTFGLSLHIDAVSWPSCSQPVSISSSSNATTETDDSPSDIENLVLSRDNEIELEDISGDDIGEPQEWATASSAAVSTSSIVSEASLPAVATTSPQAYESGGYLKRQQLWREMAELRLQAETVYHIAKHNSEVHVNGARGVGHKVGAHCDSNIEALD